MLVVSRLAHHGQALLPFGAIFVETFGHYTPDRCRGAHGAHTGGKVYDGLVLDFGYRSSCNITIKYNKFLNVELAI